ncbi:hypothetical protein HS088_TW06G00067 [Tripterygium wilfordii]|uniref:Uncharacterized protein n=1 Tax=Tripterygium wilfordii TaxID=458696 RepID=A0A7J7DHS5_TRIWF|nr:uncharacterized protein LOC120001061 [Tripterygium wilfordii]KAF5745902.1 hypothetical protein HS088_TW06G00067 [Tripterygium wilfordii]
MEDSSPAVIIPAANLNDNKNQANKNNNGKPKKKSRRVMNFLRIALYMLRRKSGAKPTRNVGLWKKLLGSMRPLHLQSNDQSPPPPLPSTALEIMPPPLDVVVEHIEEAFTPPLSPAIPSSSSSVDGGMSQYASAVNLQELDRCDEDDEGEDDEEEVYADGLGDAMIDEKAEEFIAHFYEVMRLQNMECTNRTNWSLR